jgi:hypothetical protein
MVSQGTGQKETVATYRQDGTTYEVDHLGICQPNQWGQFAIYRDGEQIAEFALAEALLRPEHRPHDLPVTTQELIRLARQAVSGGQEAIAEVMP